MSKPVILTPAHLMRLTQSPGLRPAVLSANGFDFSAVIRGDDTKKGGIFGRAGLHFSELIGAASATLAAQRTI